MLISVVIPAFNEEAYLPATLSCVRDAISASRCSAELIVVDNASADRTREVARSFGPTVVYEAVHNISRVRNAGARAARGDVLAFIYADTIVPPYFLEKVAEAMIGPAYFGGSANIVHTGEDVDFYWCLRKLAAKAGGHLSFLRDVEVVPSTRRFDKTPPWRTLIWTNPAFIALFCSKEILPMPKRSDG